MTTPPNTRPLTGRAPNVQLPSGATDCHIHLYPSAFDKEPGGPDIPEVANVADYEAFQKWLGLERVVIVQANAHQFNNAPVLESLRAMGKRRARAVIAVSPDMDIRWLRSLTDEGVCGARIMNLPGGATKLADINPVETIARDLGWSLIVQFNGNEMDAHYAAVDKIAAPFVLDHIGKFIPPVHADDNRVDAILRLIDKGHVWLKLAGAYETSITGPPDFADVAPIARRIIAHAPERIIWGSNFPHVGVPRSEYPDDVSMLELVCDWIGAANIVRVFVDNPAELYRF